MATTKDRDTKQPWEARTYEVFFGGSSGKLDEDDSLSTANCTVRAFDSNGNDVSAALIEAGSISASEQSIFARIQNGDDGMDYKIEFRGLSNKGEKVEHDIKVIVKEI